MHAVPNRKCAAQCLAATRRQVFAHVVVPATVPYTSPACAWPWATRS